LGRGDLATIASAQGKKWGGSQHRENGNQKGIKNASPHLSGNVKEEKHKKIRIPIGEVFYRTERNKVVFAGAGKQSLTTTGNVKEKKKVFREKCGGKKRINQRDSLKRKGTVVA